MRALNQAIMAISSGRWQAVLNSLRYGLASISGFLMACLVGDQPPGREFKAVADWCIHNHQLTPAAQQTVEVLLETVQTHDPFQAQERLMRLTALDLRGGILRDARPWRS